MILYKQVVKVPSVMDHKAFFKALEDNMAALNACDAEAREAGRLVGRSFSISVGDGQAIYQIIKENKKTVRVRLCQGVACDDYADWQLGAEGTMKKELAIRYTKFEDIFA